VNARDACLNDSELRALADAEAPAGNADVWSVHLAECPACRARLEQIQTGAARVASLMARLEPSPTTMDVAVAYRRLRTRVAIGSPSLKGASLMNRLFGAPRRAAVSVAGVALVAVMVATALLSPVGTLADNLLSQFRVHQFAAITIPMDMVQQYAGLSKSLTPQDVQQLQTEFQGLGSLTSTLTQHSATPVASLADAKSHMGGNLAVPSKLPQAFSGVQPKIYTGDAGTASYTMDVAKIQAALQKMSLTVEGLPDPATTPKVTFSLDIPASAVFDYQSGTNHLVVGQMVSPTLNIPSTVDVNGLRDTVLSIPGLPADLVAQIRSVNDWTHTLIVPIPSGFTSSQTTVNGSAALLITGQATGANGQGGSAVLWQKNGMLYIVAGQGLSGSDVMSVAQSM